jgi:hypothetical protein
MTDDNLAPIGTIVKTYRAGLFEVVEYVDRYERIKNELKRWMVPEDSEYADLSKPPVKYYKVQKRYNVHFHPMKSKETLVEDKVYPIGDLLTSALRKHTKSLENINKLIELNKSQYKFE